MSRVLVLAGGSPHAHDFAASGDALATLAYSQGHEAARAVHPDDAASALDGGSFDALVVAGLWWRMHGAAYDAWRTDWAYETPTATRAAIASFVRSGGGLVALHTAPICFDDWPEWHALVGGAWRWGTSSHPPYGTVTAALVAPEHPVMAGVREHIELCDEVYGGLDVRADVHVLVTARRTPDDADQPVVWAHTFGTGRVVYDCFGHDSASIAHTHNAAIIANALAWVTERS